MLGELFAESRPRPLWIQVRLHLLIKLISVKLLCRNNTVNCHINNIIRQRLNKLRFLTLGRHTAWTNMTDAHLGHRQTFNATKAWDVPSCLTSLSPIYSRKISFPHLWPTVTAHPLWWQGSVYPGPHGVSSLVDGSCPSVVPIVLFSPPEPYHAADRKCVFSGLECFCSIDKAQIYKNNRGQNEEWNPHQWVLSHVYSPYLTEPSLLSSFCWAVCRCLEYLLRWPEVSLLGKSN